MGEPELQATLREIELQRRAQVELLVEGPDQLERLSPHVHARPDHSIQARAQGERVLGEPVHEPREVRCGVM